MKGITPVIAIIILLLIAVAMAGAGWSYISRYWGGLTGKNIEVTDSFCVNGTMAYITLHNVGTEKVVPESSLSISAIDGHTMTMPPGASSYYTASPVESGSTTIFRDASCTVPGVAKACTYRITLGATGRSLEAFVDCPG